LRPRRDIAAVNVSDRNCRISKSVKLMRTKERFLDPSASGPLADMHPSASTRPQQKFTIFYSSSSKVFTFTRSVEKSLEDGKLIRRWASCFWCELVNCRKYKLVVLG
jgi:hypothetical protein